jgi:hypothetical protein
VIPVSPLHHTISKTLSKIIEEVFLTLFGPSSSKSLSPLEMKHEKNKKKEKEKGKLQ